MKLLAFILVMVFLSSAVYAGSSAFGTITFAVKNQAPKINSIALSPENAYYDSELRCLVNFSDESPSSVKITYSWKIDGIKQQNHGDTLSGFSDNETVACSATAIDEFGASSEEKNASGKIIATSAIIKVAKPLLTFIGVEPHTLKTNYSLAITGMVVGMNENSTNLIPLIVIVISLLLVLNVFLLHKIRTRYPTRDYPSSSSQRRP